MHGLGNLIGSAAGVYVTVLLRKMSFSTCSMIMMCALIWYAQLDESCSGLLIAAVHLSNQNSLDLQQLPTKHQL